MIEKVKITDNSQMTEPQIKKMYLELAKLYHPDRTNGSTEKFQQVQQAYEKLLAFKSGYTLTEEDLEQMYKE